MKKTFAVSFAIFAIGLLLGAYIAYSASPTETLYLSGGKYPSVPTFTVWREVGNYFCKDSWGRIVRDSTNASDVLGYAVAQAYAYTQDVQRGALVFIKTGWYVLTHSIPLYDRVTIQGEGISATILNSSSITIAMFDGDFATPNYWIAIKDLTIRGGAYGIYLDEAYNTLLENVRVSDAVNTGFHLEDCYSSRIYHTVASGCGQGYNISHSHGFAGYGIGALSCNGNGIYAEDMVSLSLKDIDVENCTGYGVELAGIRGGTLDGYVEYSGGADNTTEIYIHGGTIYTQTENFKTGHIYIRGSGAANSSAFWVTDSFFVTIEPFVYTLITTPVTIANDAACFVYNSSIVTLTGSNRGLYINSGSATITAHTNVNVTHLLYDVPDTVIVTPSGDINGDFWVAYRTNTTFGIWIDSSQTVSFFWYAEYKP